MIKIAKKSLRIFIIILLCISITALISCKDINELIQNLSSDNDKIRTDAENALIRIGKPAVDPLIILLKDRENPARASAAKILGEIGDSKAIKPLIDCLMDPEEYIIKDKNIEELLTELFGEKLPEAEEMPEAQPAPEIGEMPGAAEEILDNGVDTNETSANAGINSEAHLNNQYPVFKEVVYALSLLCEDSENEKIIAQEINKMDIAFVMVVYPDLIEIGASGTEDMLINALNLYGYSMMAEDFINSGNEKLEEAAKEWAKENNYTIYEMPGFGGKEWGSGRK